MASDATRPLTQLEAQAASSSLPASSSPSETASSSPSPSPSTVAGPFVLRPLLHNVPLSPDGGNDDNVKINCVEYLEGNLYIGTSASELLHFFRIPPDPSDPSGSADFILASRMRPAYAESSAAINGHRPGVQQILLLPRVGKACILCNNTVTFYSLPELSPVFSTQVKNCNWIGGVDLNEPISDNGNGRSEGVTILLSLNRRIKVVRIGEEPRSLRGIDFAGSTLFVRRDSIACVADSRSYALLDVDRNLKIPLTTISALDDSQPGGLFGQAQNFGGTPEGGLSRSASSATARLAPADTQSHARSTSLGGLIGNIRQHQRQPSRDVEDSLFQFQESPTPSRSPGPPGEASGQSPNDADKPLPPPPGGTGAQLGAQLDGSQLTPRTASPRPTPVILKPHIISPTPEEFLVVTGTSPLDAGIGMFVNLDGDPTRPTLKFSRYPREIVADGGSPDALSPGGLMGPEQEGYVLAALSREFEDGLHHGLEIQRFDVNVGEDEQEKFWLEVPGRDGRDLSPSTPIGIRSLMQSEEMQCEEVVERLCQRRFSPFTRSPGASTMSLRSLDSRTALSMERLSQEKELFERDLESEDEQLPSGWESTRNREGEEFVRSLAKSSSRLAVWAGGDIWWAVRNPLLLQLESTLNLVASNDQAATVSGKEERGKLFSLLEVIKGRDPKTELEFMTLGYIRQRVSVMLLASFLGSTEHDFTEAETHAMESNLVDGDLDARVVLSLIPALRNEIVVGRKGIWIYGGVKSAVDAYILNEKGAPNTQTVSSLPLHVLGFLRRFLTAWRRKKGFGSISDEIFRTVDASLLLVLLELDQDTPKGQAGKAGSVRKDLYELVDYGVDCFDRAVDLLETYRRLFVLSRLYQNRKMAADVLATWRRIIEGEEDAGGELGDGEQRVRGYLANISNQALVQEYGIWLATRNPKLGVQVFSDERAKAPKFDPVQVVALLREEAPDAVKYYLEHLVFGKGHTAYVNELITYYLDIVISDLQSSPASREMVAASYEAYRALRPPKPTYRQFLTDNAPPNDEVWQSRLRLLQLLGGNEDYDTIAIQERMDSLTSSLNKGTQGQYQQLLVPEAIILNGRARRHEDALRLLVHHLGDYDTAVSYCLRAGPSAQFSPIPSTDSLLGKETLLEAQTRLFRFLLGEFLTISDLGERVEQTGLLLERFGGWFDVLEVLDLIPDGWPVEIVAGFLVQALRRLVRERHESLVVRSLSGAENLRVNHDLILEMDEKGPFVERETADVGDSGVGMEMDDFS